MQSDVLITHTFPGTWETREEREPNYWPLSSNSFTALEPRNGEGRWASDRVFGGGLALPGGICYWAMMGVGEIDYKKQNLTFSDRAQGYKYTYHNNDHTLIGWEECPLTEVGGHEIDDQGRIYLSQRRGWGSELYQTDVLVRVYE